MNVSSFGTRIQFGAATTVKFGEEKEKSVFFRNTKEGAKKATDLVRKLEADDAVYKFTAKDGENAVRIDVYKSGKTGGAQAGDTEELDPKG